MYFVFALKLCVIAMQFLWREREKKEVSIYYLRSIRLVVNPFLIEVFSGPFFVAFRKEGQFDRPKNCFVKKKGTAQNCRTGTFSSVLVTIIVKNQKRSSAKLNWTNWHLLLSWDILLLSWTLSFFYSWNRKA